MFTQAPKRKTRVGSNCDDIDIYQISCIAFLMLGFYVEHDRLVALIIDLPFDKNRLITLKILSKLQLAKFSSRNLQLHRLHFTVPHKVELETGEQRKNKREEETRDTEVSSRGERMEEMSKKIGDDDDPLVFDKNIGHKRTSTCKPVTKITQSTWSSQEIEFLHEVRSLDGINFPEKYERFKLKCLKSNIPLRTFGLLSQNYEDFKHRNAN